jgi:ribosome-associated protein
MDSEQLKALVIDALDDLKAQDITEIYVKSKTSITDYMIIATGTSSRHVQAVIDHVHEKVKAAGVMPLGSEGRGQTDWVLLDLTDVVVHVMTAQARAYYDLERLWGDGGKVVTH